MRKQRLCGNLRPLDERLIIRSRDAYDSSSIDTMAIDHMLVFIKVICSEWPLRAQCRLWMNLAFIFVFKFTPHQTCSLNLVFILIYCVEYSHSLFILVFVHDFADERLEWRVVFHIRLHQSTPRDRMLLFFESCNLVALLLLPPDPGLLARVSDHVRNFSPDLEVDARRLFDQCGG
jgi:hypothetical protein